MLQVLWLFKCRTRNTAERENIKFLLLFSRLLSVATVRQHRSCGVVRGILGVVLPSCGNILYVTTVSGIQQLRAVLYGRSV